MCEETEITLICPQDHFITNAFAWARYGRDNNYTCWNEAISQQDEDEFENGMEVLDGKMLINQ